MAMEVTIQPAPEAAAQVPAGIVIDVGNEVIRPSSTDRVIGRRVRKLTNFGLRQAQEAAEKKDKGAKLSKRKAAAVRVKAQKTTPQDGGKPKGTRATKRTRR